MELKEQAAEQPRQLTQLGRVARVSRAGAAPLLGNGGSHRDECAMNIPQQGLSCGPGTASGFPRDSGAQKKHRPWSSVEAGGESEPSEGW